MKVALGIGVAFVVFVAVILAGGYVLPAKVRLDAQIYVERPAYYVNRLLKFPKDYETWLPWSGGRLRLPKDYNHPERAMDVDDWGVPQGMSVGWVPRWFAVLAPEQVALTWFDDEIQVDYQLNFPLGLTASSWIKMDGACSVSGVRWTVLLDAGHNPLHRYQLFFLKNGLYGDMMAGLRRLKRVVEASPLD